MYIKLPKNLTLQRSLQRRKNRWIGCLLLLIPVWSCNQTGHNEAGKRVDTAVKKIDPVSPVPVSAPVDTVISADLAALRVYFQKTPGQKVDSTQKIPLSLMARFIKGPNFDTTKYVSEVNPVDVFANRHGYFFIVRVVCSDGGACANYYLLAFDKKGYDTSTQSIGSETGEESFINLVSYRLRSDTVLVTYVVKNTDSEDGGEKLDTLEKHVFRLTIPFHG